MRGIGGVRRSLMRGMGGFGHILEAVLLVTGLIPASSKLELYENGVLVGEFDITTLAHHLGPQNFSFNLSGSEVVVSRSKKQWLCRATNGENVEWAGKIVLFNRRSWCKQGVEQMYRRLNRTKAQMIVKVSRYSPPGMWYYLHAGFGAKHTDTGMVLAQVNIEVIPLMKQLERAKQDGSIDSYRLVAWPDANKWEERYTSALYVLIARIFCPLIYLCTAARAAMNLFHLLRGGCAITTIDVTHMSLFLDMLRSLLMCVFLIDHMGNTFPWEFVGSFLMGMPGFALFSWTLVALKWREVRHATASNRPIKNTLRRYPRIILCCTILLASDIWVFVEHSSGAKNTFNLYIICLKIYGACGCVVCAYLLKQGVKVLRKLRAEDVSDLDQELVRAFKSMTMWLMVGACASAIWLGVIVFQAIASATFSWFWSLDNHVRFYMIIQNGLAFTSFAYVMSLTPLAQTAGVMDRFGKWLTMLDAATAAALLGDACGAETGEVDSSGVIKRGIASFRGIRLSELSKADFESNRSEVTPEGAHMEEVDWFISHSWHDSVHAKWEMLQTLAQTFERQHGREPLMWIDKFCIDQNNISASLMYLPIYLLLCKKMVVLAGETYTTRLWCNWELYMCYGLGTTPMIEVEFLPVGAFPLTHFADCLAEFDITDADCFLASDKEKMLEVIEKSTKGQDGFNKAIRKLAARVRKSVEGFQGRTSTMNRTTVCQRGSGFTLVELAPRLSDAEFIMEMTLSEKATKRNKFCFTASEDVPKRTKFSSSASEDIVRDRARAVSANY